MLNIEVQNLMKPCQNMYRKSSYLSADDESTKNQRITTKAEDVHRAVEHTGKHTNRTDLTDIVGIIRNHCYSSLFTLLHSSAVCPRLKTSCLRRCCSWASALPPARPAQRPLHAKAGPTAGLGRYSRSQYIALFYSVTRAMQGGFIT